MPERMAIIEDIKSRTSTHSCPKCDGPAYCGMEAGKSASACWCMSLPPVNDKPNTLIGETCYCKTCMSEMVKVA